MVSSRIWFGDLFGRFVDIGFSESKRTVRSAGQTASLLYGRDLSEKTQRKCALMRKSLLSVGLLSSVLIVGCGAQNVDAPATVDEAPAAVEPAPRAPAFDPPEGTLIERDLQVRMRDGVRLNTDIYVPNGGANPVAAILIRTPYSTELRARTQRLLEQGYAIIEQHERGRYLSEGDFTMIPRPAEDGWDTLDWIAAQSWSDGRVATIGCSSSAENQLKLAAAAHPAHKAFIALSAGVGVAEADPFKEQGNFWRGGVWQV